MDLEKKLDIVLMANERLENDNKKLREQLQNTQKIKPLIEDVSEAKKTYNELHEELQNEIAEYKKLIHELYKIKQEILLRQC